MGRETVNAKLYFKFSTLKNNKENARLYFNDLLKDQFSSVASVVQSSPTLYNPMDPSLSLRVCLNSCPLSWLCPPTISSSVVPFCSGSIFPRIRVFSNESVLYIRWPKYWSFSFSISTSNEYSGMTL